MKSSNEKACVCICALSVEQNILKGEENLDGEGIHLIGYLEFQSIIIHWFLFHAG